ncbi:MAG: N-6 DNA methylase [Candidatus Lokiarchaeota archaeon]|nr:N-6 DNA methylase [Candidatus Lokiarchaeota archaeon]
MNSNNNSLNIVAKVWNYCNLLRDEGIGYGDYLEQLTYLLFLKMADEYSKPPYNRVINIPKEYKWESLRTKKAAALENHYNELLQELGKEKGMIGEIFFNAQNKIKNPAQLHRLVQLINSETWVGMEVDVKGEIYEGLLEKFAADTKTGAGQYFTPRPLIKAMVEVMQPEPDNTMADPACGTGGFFLAYHDFITEKYGKKMDKDQKDFLRFKTFRGWEIVPSTSRLCLMNMFLHNIGDLNSEPPLLRSDSLAEDYGTRFDYVMTNPPFGKKSSITITTEDGTQKKESFTYQRQDFWATTSNKQLNFVQHVRTMLTIDGKAAVVVPDNVLFEGGAGETVRKKLLQQTNLHTILRLPTGIFYAQGVKANVIFFDNKPASPKPWTKDVWYYDMRTNKHFTLKTRKLQFEDLQDFIKCYNPENRHKRTETERFRKFTYDDIIARDKTSLDIFWLKDDSLIDLDNLPDPDVLAAEIIESIESGLENFKELVSSLGNDKPISEENQSSAK